MKKLLSLLLVLLLLLCGCGAPTEPTITQPSQDTTPQETVAPWMTFPAERELTATQYFVYDCQAQQFTVTSGDTGEKVYPASITKLFSAYVAAQYLPKDKLITAGDSLNLVVAGSSVAGLKKGDKLTVSQLIEAMMLPSGNDAAYVLAVEAGRVLAGKSAGTQAAVNAFVSEMNRQAKLLGMKNTNFANPDSIHKSNHYSSFDDLALLGMLSLEDPVLLQYAGTANDTVTLTEGEVAWKNTNALIHPDSEYYCPYAIGLKTGQTPSAGSCLLSGFVTPERKLVIGVFQCEETEDRFADTLYLLNQELGLQ